MKTILQISGMLSVFFLFSACEPKEDLTPIKKEVVNLRTVWVDTESDLTRIMTEMKNSSKTVNEQLVTLKEISEKGDPMLKKQAEIYLFQADEERKVIVVQMKTLNGIIHEWSNRSKDLNLLIELVSNEDITIEEGSQMIKDLKDFQANVNPTFHRVIDNLEIRKETIKKIASFVRRYQ